MAGWSHGAVLALALQERGVQCAQVRRQGRGVLVERVGLWQLPDGGWTADPAALGASLRTYLQQQHFTATRTVIGAPAKWLIAHQRDVPPAAAAQTATLLRLQVERLAAADHTPMVYDVADSLDTATARRVMLIGMLQQQVDRLTALCKAANLTPTALTATGLVLAQQAERDGTVIVLGNQGAEMVTKQVGRPCTLRHLTLTPTAGGDLAGSAGEIRRAVSLSGTEVSAVQLLRLGGTDWTEPMAEDLAQRTGLASPRSLVISAMPVRVSAAAVNGQADHLDPDRVTAAALLGAAALKSRALPVNLWHSRLAPLPVRRIGRRMVWAALLAVVAVVALVSLYVTVRQREAEVVELDQRLRLLTPDIRAAQATIDAVTLGRGYFQTRPPLLPCLKEVTLAIGRDEALWVTSFLFRDSGRGQFQGKSTDQKTVLAVLDRLKNHPRFDEVKLMDLRDAAGSKREITFTISFHFNAGGAP